MTSVTDWCLGTEETRRQGDKESKEYRTYVLLQFYLQSNVLNSLDSLSLCLLITRSFSHYGCRGPSGQVCRGGGALGDRTKYL